jgi:predicted Rossmann fold nucleotide-binding protein DprA/Smf involved in DNA uptake
LTGAERGFLLLCSHMGDPEREVLSVSRFRQLMAKGAAMEKPDSQRELNLGDLTRLGVGRTEGEQILRLLDQEQLLENYLNRAQFLDCFPMTRASEAYPLPLRQKLGPECPACLWVKGDVTLLDRPLISLVGSRDLYPENEVFARYVGYQAALQGYVLVSGNARGADRTAQQACLRAGGQVISVVADRLDSHPLTERVLWLAEDSYDLDFSAKRALSRNRIIHALTPITLVAQCRAGRGGTWSGTVHNLRHRWSKVYVFRDGSEAERQLCGLGATAVETDDLTSFQTLCTQEQLRFCK